MSYTVTAADAADGQSDFKVQLLTNSPGKTETAAANYTVSCTAPASSRTLILQKKVTNTSSVALPSGTSFSLAAGGQAATATTAASIAAGAANQSVPVSNGTITTLAAGSYTVSETLPAAPTGTQWSAPAYACSVTTAGTGTSASGANITFGSAGNPVVTCTVTNTLTDAPSSRTLILQKKVTNTSSVALPSGTSFSISAGGQSATGSTSGQINAGTANQNVTLTGGTITTLAASTAYTVSEALPAAPSGTQWSSPAYDCQVTTPGGTATASGNGFNFGTGGNPTVTCTVTNTLVDTSPQQGTINLKKTTTGPNSITLTSSSSFNLTLTPTGGGSTVTQAIPVTGFTTSSAFPQTLSTGTYTFGEGSLPSAPSGAPAGSTWQNTGLSCSVSNNAGNTQVDASGKVVTLGAGGVVDCAATNTLNAPFQKGSITIIKQVTGGTSSDVFNFVAPDGNHALQSGGSFTVSNLNAPGPYTITEQANAAFFAPSISCTTSNASYSVQSATRSVQITFSQVYSGSLSATCTFYNKKEKDDRAQDITKLYLHRNLDNLLSNDPDRARILRRLDGTPEPAPGLKDGGAYSNAGDSPVPGGLKDPLRSDLQRLQGRSDNPSMGGLGDIRVSASLSQAQAEAAAQEKQKLADAGLVYNLPYGYNVAALQPRFDVWVEGHLAKYSDGLGGIDRDGTFGILYVGADYVIRPGLLVGALVQFDRTSENINNPDIWGQVLGSGWMAGPYMGAKLSENLYFDARAAWGQSTNEIWLQDNVSGYRTGTFNADRWLTTASLTGNYRFGAFRVSPQLELAYGGQSADAYHTSLGQIVDKTSVAIGRLSFGPEFGYTFRLDNGIAIEPQFSVKGIWGFDDGPLYLSTGVVSPSEFRAQVEGGVMVKMPDGFAVRASGSYDGIGDRNLEVWTGKVWLNFPLN